MTNNDWAVYDNVEHCYVCNIKFDDASSDNKKTQNVKGHEYRQVS